MRKPGSVEARYAVEGGELYVNGSRLAISPKCVRLCLSRHGLDPHEDHERLPAQVGRHILRISAFVLAFAMGRSRDRNLPQTRIERR